MVAGSPPTVVFDILFKKINFRLTVKARVRHDIFAMVYTSDGCLKLSSVFFCVMRILLRTTREHIITHYPQITENTHLTLSVDSNNLTNPCVFHLQPDAAGAASGSAATANSSVHQPRTRPAHPPAPVSPDQRPAPRRPGPHTLPPAGPTARGRRLSTLALFLSIPLRSGLLLHRQGNSVKGKLHTDELQEAHKTDDNISANIGTFSINWRRGKESWLH